MAKYHHPYEVACELTNQENSLRALLMASMIRAHEGPNFERLINAFPEVHLDLVRFSSESKRGILR